MPNIIHIIQPMHTCHQKLIIRLLLAAAVFLLAGCSHRQNIGGGFELRQTASWNPDGHPGVFLYYDGNEVWHHISWGYPESPENFVHDGIFVFESPVPASDGRNDYAISPQLFAVRGPGPPVLISQRMMGQPLKGKNSYDVDNSSLTENGVRVRFEFGGEDDVIQTNDVSWADIEKWVAEAAPSNEVKTPLGNYRLLR